MRRSATSASGSSLRISRTTAFIAQKVARDFLRPCPPNKVIITFRTCRREPPMGRRTREPGLICEGWLPGVRRGVENPCGTPRLREGPATALDVGGCFLDGDPTLRRAKPRRVAQRLPPCATAHLGLDGPQPQSPRGSHTMVAVDEQRSLRGLEDQDRRKVVERPGVAFYPCSVEMCLGIDGRGGQEFVYPQTRHGAHTRRSPRGLQPSIYPTCLATLGFRTVALRSEGGRRSTTRAGEARRSGRLRP